MILLTLICRQLLAACCVQTPSQMREPLTEEETAETPVPYTLVQFEQPAMVSVRKGAGGGAGGRGGLGGGEGGEKLLDHRRM